jgi:hypothetical protein
MVHAYSRKTGKSESEVLAIMKAETWINATEAISGGWANRMTAPKKMMAVAKTNSMPQGVYTSLFGDGSEAVTQRVKQKEIPMSDTQPVAASLAEIKAAVPKMKADFVLSCLEKKLPLASVMTEALGAMEEELTALRAKLAQYEQDEAAKAMEPEEEVVPESKAMEDEEEKVEAKAKAKAKLGVKPVAKSALGSSGKPSATVQWSEAVESLMPVAKSKVKAAALANKKFPGLRQAMIDEANAS